MTAQDKACDEDAPKDEPPKAVRLDLDATNYARLVRCARRLGLSLASYARMAVLGRIDNDERAT